MNYGLGWVAGAGAHVRELISSWIKRVLGPRLNFESGVQCLVGHDILLKNLTRYDSHAISK